MTSLAQQYNQFATHAAFAECGPRTQIEITGNDRVKFLNNFCTGDIARLSPGSGTEAFVTNVKGKVLGHVWVYCGEHSLALETVAGQADVLLAHFDRYILSDDVLLSDASDGWAFYYVGGPKAETILQTLVDDLPPLGYLNFKATKLGNLDIALACGGAVNATGWTLCVDGLQQESLVATLTNAGLHLCEQGVLELFRVESGTPAFGQDITEGSLPQEVNRNDIAISFNKGCYLGQETVARLDALGHVNKLLMGVKFLGQEIPAVGAELFAGENAVGKVTSAIDSPQLGLPLALAYIRTGHESPGTVLQSDVGEAEIVRLPLV